MWFATLTVAVLCFGLTQRKKPKLHAKIMTLGILMDLGLVLKLQIQRDAVGAAISHSYGLLQYLHFSTSGLASLLYFPVLYLGYKNLKALGTPHPELRLRHVKVAGIAITLRLLGFLFMFSMIGNLKGGT